jgi:dGTP triphosphohydrolase
MGNVEVDSDKERLHLTKKLVDCEEYSDTLRYLHSIKQWCAARSMPSFIRDGVYVVSLDLVPEFTEYLRKSEKILKEKYVPGFLTVYPAQIEVAKKALREQYDESDYPSPTVVENSFGIKWAWITFGVPENLPSSIKKEEQEKMRKAFQDAQEEILAALRSGFADMIDHAVTRLKVQPGQKPKIFKDSLIENFQEFFETFQARNLMEDEELAEMVAKAKKVLTKVTGDKLRELPGMREKTTAAFEEIKKEMDRLVTEKPSRRFSYEGD